MLATTLTMLLGLQERQLAWHEVAKLIAGQGISHVALVLERGSAADVKVSTIAPWRHDKTYVNLLTCTAPGIVTANKENLARLRKLKPISTKDDADMSRWIELAVTHFVGMEKRIGVSAVKSAGSLSEGEYVGIVQTAILDDSQYIYLNWMGASNKIIRQDRLMVGCALAYPW